MTGSVL